MPSEKGPQDPQSSRGPSLEQARADAEICLSCPDARCMDACGKDIPGNFRVMTHEIDWLRRTLSTKADFLNTLSHDLRTPLAVILGNTDLIEKGMLGDLTPQLERSVEQIRKNATQLLGMLNQLLSLSRIEAGQVRLQPVEANLTDLMCELSEGMSTLARAKGLEFHWKVEVDADLDTDIPKLKEVLYNLLTNAIKYTDRGRVSFRAGLRAGEDLVWFEVADTGIGIAEEDLPHIFEPFRQAGQTRSGGCEGAGLGLAIVRRLLGILGGEIAVQSTPKRGSLFTVYLPRVMSPPQDGDSG